MMFKFALYCVVLILSGSCQKRSASLIHPVPVIDSIPKVDSLPVKDSLPTKDSVPIIDTIPKDTPVTREFVEYKVAPAVTDPGINTALENHFATVAVKGSVINTLFVFLPGSYRSPEEYKAIVQKAASMGYHAIGLMYPNRKPVNPICKAGTDTTCHERARLEVVDGIDRHQSIDVNPANSIINRLQKLLVYLQANHPTQNWGQFLNGNTVDWTKIVISGHSQGGCTACVIGRFYPIKRVVSLSGVDFFLNDVIPDWENRVANKGKYYSLFNPGDEQIPYNKAEIALQHMQLPLYGATVNVNNSSFPYGNTHTLITTIEPKVSYIDIYHNSTAVDAYIPKDAHGVYVLDKAWEYMLTP